jgi:hypothetical protein
MAVFGGLLPQSDNKKATEKFSTIQSLKKLKEFLLEMKASL